MTFFIKRFMKKSAARAFLLAALACGRNAENQCVMASCCMHPLHQRNRNWFVETNIVINYLWHSDACQHFLFLWNLEGLKLHLAKKKKKKREEAQKDRRQFDNVVSVLFKANRLA